MHPRAAVARPKLTFISPVPAHPPWPVQLLVAVPGGGFCQLKRMGTNAHGTPCGRWFGLE
jgi:hypothetical protein